MATFNGCQNFKHRSNCCLSLQFILYLAIHIMKTAAFLTDNFQFRTIAEALLTIAVTSRKGQTDKKKLLNQSYSIKTFLCCFCKTYLQTTTEYKLSTFQNKFFCRDISLACTLERKLLRALGRFGSKEGKSYKIYFII